MAQREVKLVLSQQILDRSGLGRISNEITTKYGQILETAKGSYLLMDMGPSIVGARQQTVERERLVQLEYPGATLFLLPDYMDVPSVDISYAYVAGRYYQVFRLGASI